MSPALAVYSQEERFRAIRAIIAATIAGLIAATLPVFAADLIVVESQSTTAQDVPLIFEVEKTKWDCADLHVWNFGGRI